MPCVNCGGLVRSEPLHLFCLVGKKNKQRSNYQIVFFSIFALCAKTTEKSMVPRKGIEPPHLAAAGPKPAASTNFATWALPRLASRREMPVLTRTRPIPHFNRDHPILSALIAAERLFFADVAANGEAGRNNVVGLKEARRHSGWRLRMELTGCFA